MNEIGAAFSLVLLVWFIRSQFIKTLDVVI